MKILKFLYMFFWKNFGLVIFVTSSVVALSSTELWANNHETAFHITVMVLVLLFYPGVFFLLYYRIKSFNEFTQSVGGILRLYFEIILVFSSMYLWLAIFSSSQYITGFHQIPAKLFTQEEYEYGAFFKNMLLVLLDSIHFSIVTSATLGAGDMVPKAPLAKILVDFQVLFSVGLIALGLGKHFDRK